MPGIFGAYNMLQTDMANTLYASMAKAMDSSGKLAQDRYMEDNLLLGRIHLDIFKYPQQPVVSEDGSRRLVFHGELYGRNSSDGAHGAAGDVPGYLLKRFEKKGDTCVRDLNGVFHFVVFDKAKHRLKLFSDQFGLQPMYYSLFSGGIVFSAKVAPLLEARGISREPDYQGMADFFHFGQILGKKTLFKHIRLLPPASILTFDGSTGKAEVTKYASLVDNFCQKEADDCRNMDPEPVVNKLVSAIQSRSELPHLLGLSLSGGLDSRGILAGMGSMAKGIKTYTLGLPGCADEKLAGRMAAAAGTTHEFVPLDRTYLENFENMANQMIRFSDGMYHPHESTEMLALDYLNKADFKILLRGHGGEIAKAALAYPVMATPRINDCHTGDQALNEIFAMTNLVLRDIDPDRLFQPDFAKIMKSAPTASLEDSCKSASDILAPADLCVFYYIKEHIRRQVVASLDIFRTCTEIRLPYVDGTFIENLLKLPLSMRNRGEIHHLLVKKCMPDLLKIPDSNTGAPMDAGAARLFLTDKFNSLMKKLSIKGFRHYTEFEKWHRGGFQQSSRNIIFSSRTRDRGIYRMDYLDQVFQSHMSGQKDYARLLGTIVGIELWFRNFVD